MSTGWMEAAPAAVRAATRGAAFLFAAVFLLVAMVLAAGAVALSCPAGSPRTLVAHAIERHDAVRLELRNGKELRGLVFDLRRGLLEVRHHLGGTKVAKSDVVRWTLVPGSTETPSSLLVLKDGRIVSGKAEFDQHSGEWTIEMAMGVARYPVDQVDRVVSPNGRCDDAAQSFMPRRGFDELLKNLLTRLRQEPEAARRGTVQELEACGYFAIRAVEESLRKEGDVDGLLARFLNREKLCALLPAVVDESFPELLGSLLERNAETSLTLLESAVADHGEQMYGLLGQLVLDEQSAAAVRSYSLDYLQRTNRIRELVTAYQAARGQTQFAIAVALGDLGHPVGVPTLVDALKLENPEARKLAFEKLVEYTGESFGYDPAIKGGENLTAIAHWQEWYRTHEQKIEANLSYALAPEVANPARARASRYWREGLAKLEASDLPLAEQLFRRSIQEDPSFLQPYLSIGVLMYQERGEYSQAIDWLERAVRLAPSDAEKSTMALAYYHLGRLHDLGEDPERARTALKRAVELNENFGDAWYDLGDVMYRQALSSRTATPEQRRETLQQACATWETGYGRVNADRLALVLMRREENFGDDTVALSRREHNRSIRELREAMRALEGRLAYRCAQAELAIGNTARALEWIDKALEGVDGEVPHQRLRAQILRKLGREAEAAEADAKADAMPKVPPTGG